jgi:hypothetical protein
MKKIICLPITFFTLLVANIKSLAQANKKESFSINFGPELLVPESNFRRTHNIGYGTSIKAEYTFGKHLSTTVNSGFTTFKGRGFFPVGSSIQEDYKSILAIPIKAGARYYLGNFYFQGEGGLIFLNRFTNATNAVFTVGLGDKIKLGYNKLDISLRQEIWLNSPDNFNMAVIRVAYEIVWRK